MIQLELQGPFERLIRRFEQVRDALDTETVLDEAGALLLNRIRTSFLSEKDPDEKPWLPSKAAIIRRSGGFTYGSGETKGKYTGTGTLYESGNLFRSIQLGTRGAGERVIATDVPYAKFHQFGVPGRLPIRLFLGFGEKDEELVQRFLELRIERLLRG